MKKTSILSVLALAAFAGTSFAQTTVINVTGATAFRVGAIQTIKGGYTTLTDIASNGGNALDTEEGASRSIFRGTFTNITGTTIIRCNWSGSVEGIRDVITLPQPTIQFLTTDAFTAGTAFVGGDAPNTRNSVPLTGSNVTTATARFAFSDVYATTSPYPQFQTGVVDTTIGVLPFFCVISDGAPSDITNMQATKFGQLMNIGFKSAAFLFNSTDSRNVYATGRNDASGTRSTYLAISRGPSETKSGDVAGVVQQWKATGDATANTTIQNWPTNDGSNRSLIWNPDTAGNGGYSSGGNVATALGATSTGVTILDPDGGLIDGPVDVLLCSVIGQSDASNAQSVGAKVLSWDGQAITVPAPNTALANTEVAKISNGSYTLWSYEHLIYKGALNANESAFFTKLTTDLGGSLGTAGIPLGSVSNAARATDGAYVTGL